MAGADLVAVRYRGVGAALPALMSGRVDVMFDPLISAIGFINAGRLFARAHLLLVSVVDERQIKCRSKKGGGTVSKKVCRSYCDFLADFRATSLRSASSLCEEPSGLSNLTSVWSLAVLPAESLMAPLALSGAPFRCSRSIVHSLAVMPYEHNSGDGPQFLR
jgi:hypothetical protein